MAFQNFLNNSYLFPISDSYVERNNDTIYGTVYHLSTTDGDDILTISFKAKTQSEADSATILLTHKVEMFWKGEIIKKLELKYKLPEKELILRYPREMPIKVVRDLQEEIREIAEEYCKKVKEKRKRIAEEWLSLPNVEPTEGRYPISPFKGKSKGEPIVNMLERIVTKDSNTQIWINLKREIKFKRKFFNDPFYPFEDETIKKFMKPIPII